MLNKYLSIIVCLIFLSCSHAKKDIAKKEKKGTMCEGFWFKNTYYGNKQIQTSTLMSKDTIPIKIVSYRKNGSRESEFLFGQDRDSLGYGLVIHYDSASKIENVEVIGISTSDLWKGYTLFYRESDIQKIDMNKYKEWEGKVNVKGKSYNYDW